MFPGEPSLMMSIDALRFAICVTLLCAAAVSDALSLGSVAFLPAAALPLAWLLLYVAPVGTGTARATLPAGAVAVAEGRSCWYSSVEHAQPKTLLTAGGVLDEGSADRDKTRFAAPPYCPCRDEQRVRLERLRETS